MGTNYIAPTWRMPRNANKDKLSNYSIDFDTADAVAPANNPSVNLTSHTVSAWIKPNGTTGGIIKIHCNQRLWYLNVIAGGIRYTIASTLDSTTPVLTTEWTHVVASIDQSVSPAVWKIYQNGVETATKTGSVTIGDWGGGSNEIGNSFDGKISQVCLFDYALTDGSGGTVDQISYLYNLNNPMVISGVKPIAYWPLGDNSNPNATAGYPNISVGADSVFDFESGSTTFIKAFDVPVTTFTECTFSAWVNFETVTGTYQYVMGMGSGPGNFMSISKNQNSGSWYTYDGTGSSSTVATPVANRWYHVVVTQTGTTRRFYIDGVEDANSPFTVQALAIPYDNLTLGAYNNFSSSTPSVLYKLDGQLSNVQVWDKKIEQADVTTLYNNGQPLMTGTQPQEANLQAWYKLNQSANYDGGVSGIAFEVDQIGSPDVGGSGDHAYVNPSLSPLSFECQDLNSVGTGAPNYDLAYPVSNGIRWKSLKVYGRYSNLYLSANISLQNGSTSFGYAGARLMYKIDGGSLVVWQDINVNPTDPNSLIAFNPTKSSLSCDSSIEIWIECGTSNYSTSRVRIDNVTIKEGGSTGTNIYNEDFSSQSGAGWNGTYTPANSETYVDPVWQIPDNRSAYPQSFEFDGVSDKITIPKGSMTDTGAKSVSVWIKNEITSGTDYVFNSRAGGGTTNGITLIQTTTTGYIISNSYNPFQSSKIATGYRTQLHIPNDGKWHHIAWTTFPQVQRLKAYIDGVFVYEFIGTTTVDTTPSTDITLGATTSPWTGKLSNFQIWDDVVLSDGGVALNDPATGQIAELYNNGVPLTTAIASDNLKAWYKLDNTELFDGTNWSVENQKYPAGFDSALNFDGSNDDISITQSNLGTSNTISLWYKSSGKTPNYFTLLGDSTAPNEYAIWVQSGSIIWYKVQDASNGNINWSVSNVDDGKWHNFVFARTNTTVNFYIDGNLQTVNSNTLANNDTKIDSIGSKPTLGDFFKGELSNLVFWNSDQSSEKDNIYNNGTPSNSYANTPVSWWKLNNLTTGIQDSTGSNDGTNNGATKVSTFVSTEAGISSGMTEQNLVNNNVSVFNGESSGMNSTNLVQSNLTRTQPYSNYSINFDPGINEYFPIPSVAGTNIQPDEAQLDGAGFSVSAWVNADDITTAFLGIWQNDGLGVANYYGLSLGINSNFSGAVNIGFSDGAGIGTANRKNYITASGVITAGEWYNIIACYNNPDVDPILYINGVEHTGGFPNTSGTMLTPLGYSATGEGSIGVIRNGVSDFNGKISNVSIYDHRITAEEALIIYNNGITQDLQNANLPGLIYWWPMDESNIYYDGSSIYCREKIVAKDLVGNNSGNVDDIVGNAPGSESSGTGTNLTIADLKGNMYNSKLNAYSINMADYADGVTNPANSGRSTEVPSV